MTLPEIQDQQETRGSGYDAARSARDEDHLNRWPFAQKIYRIVSSGPRDWSVRIGVYGEWGSGKTSVINFGNSMARGDGNVIFTFDPGTAKILISACLSSSTNSQYPNSIYKIYECFRNYQTHYRKQIYLWITA